MSSETATRGTGGAMIVIEQTHWPLIAVGSIPEPEGHTDHTVPDESLLWASDDLRLALVVRGDHASAWRAEAEVFTWLLRHRDQLWLCASRVAWVFEDEAMR